MTNVYLKSQVELWINLYQAVKLTHFLIELSKSYTLPVWQL